ncbi:Uncharacterised protein [Mycoplasmopsis maculosa]|uniref:Uncharacterized protein n=2 Tax=Mycoplasmopsis maculosa TaxID=114885 RepID=A0A449B4J2_9BACT|nr:Uncharacterised protein [Mycoplasmopsis maculosa]
MWIVFTLSLIYLSLIIKDSVFYSGKYSYKLTIITQLICYINLLLFILNICTLIVAAIKAKKIGIKIWWLYLLNLKFPFLFSIIASILIIIELKKQKIEENI